MDPTKITEKAIDDTIRLVSEFHSAIQRAQMKADADKYIEVSQEVFDHFTQGHPTPYFWHGNPGVKVFIKGTRDSIERKEKITTNQSIFGTN